MMTHPGGGGVVVVVAEGAVATDTLTSPEAVNLEVVEAEEQQARLEAVHLREKREFKQWNPKKKL